MAKVTKVKTEPDIHFIFLGAMNAAIGVTMISLWLMLYFQGVTICYERVVLGYIGPIAFFSVLVGLYLISSAFTIIKREIRTSKKK